MPGPAAMDQPGRAAMNRPKPSRRRKSCGNFSPAIPNLEFIARVRRLSYNPHIVEKEYGMGEYFSLNYSGAPFVLFDKAHLIALGILATIYLSLLYFRTVWDEAARAKVRVGIAAFLFVSELAWHVWSYSTGTWTIQTHLPLHLCSVFLWLSIIMLLTKNYAIFELAYFLGIGGAIQAVITPESGIYGLPHFRAIQTLAAHGGIVFAGLFMTWVEGFRPTWSSFKKVFIWTNIYMVFIFFINQSIGSNYLFLAHKPFTPTLIDLLAPWPWYILQLEVIALAVCLVLYLPFAVKDWSAGGQTVTA
jgi:hypothetical integral membrane protein (TIGR02206 family)